MRPWIQDYCFRILIVLAWFLHGEGRGWGGGRWVEALHLHLWKRIILIFLTHQLWEPLGSHGCSLALIWSFTSLPHVAHRLHAVQRGCSRLKLLRVFIFLVTKYKFCSVPVHFSLKPHAMYEVKNTSIGVSESTATCASTEFKETF